MGDKVNKWDRVEGIISKPELATQEDITKSISLPAQAIKTPDGIIAKFREHSISRKAGIEMMKKWYESQLEVTKDQLENAVRVKKKETSLEVEKYLQALNAKHLDYLRELGMKNLDQRMNAIVDLNEKTARQMEDLQSRDWPPSLSDKAIDGIMELNRRFFEKLMEE